MSTNIDQLPYVTKIAALTDLYVELSLPLPAALRAAEADLRRADSSGWRGKLGSRDSRRRAASSLRGSSESDGRDRPTESPRPMREGCKKVIRARV
jgi:hypothetical protein